MIGSSRPRPCLKARSASCSASTAVQEQILWRQTVLTADLENKSPENSFASCTPATDGERVYVAFLDIKQVVVAAFDFSGKQLWLVRPGEFQNDHGFSSSPILYEDKVILSAQGKQGNFLVALSRADGHTLWKNALDHPSNSFGQPLARLLAGRPQIILCGDKTVTGFSPADGARLWFVESPSTDFVLTPVFSERAGLLLTTSSWPKKELQAIRPDGQGDVTETKIVWRSVPGSPYVPSPIAVDRFFLTVADAGNEIYCFEAATGQNLWHEPFGRSHASPVSVGGLVYFLNDQGVTHVIKAGEDTSSWPRTIWRRSALLRPPSAAAKSSCAGPPTFTVSGGRRNRYRTWDGQPAVQSHHLQESLRHFRRCRRDANAGILERGDFGRRGAFAAAHNGPGVAHAPAGRGGGAGNETGDRLSAVVPDPGGGFLFRCAADFTDHDDAMRVRVGIEQLDDFQVGGAVDRIAADADAGGLADAAAGELPDGFVGEGAAAGNDADLALLVNVTWRDANATAAVRILARAGRDDAGAIGADQPGRPAFHRPLDLHHVVDRDALGDADDEVQSGIHAFKDRVGRKGRGHEDGRGGGAGLLHGLGNGIEDRDFVFKQLSALARGDTGDDLRAIGEAELGVPRAKAAGDALDQDAGLWSDQDRHGSGELFDERFVEHKR